MRTITPAARELLKHLEGEHGGKPSLIGYPDEAGVPTWGYGHTGPEVKVGVSITPDQAERDLNADLAEPCDCIEREVKVALNDNQFAALVIWLFNVGVDELSSSTLLRQLNKSNYAAVPDQIKRWDKVTDPITKKKKPSVGLQARRAAEVALWLTPVESGASDAPAATLAPQEQPQTRSTPVAPPQPTNVLGTSTGKAQAGAIAATAGAAVIQGIQQAQPVISAVKDASATISGLPPYLMIVGWGLALATIGFCAWTLWDRHRKLKSEGS